MQKSISEILIRAMIALLFLQSITSSQPLLAQSIPIPSIQNEAGAIENCQQDDQNAEVTEQLNLVQNFLQKEAETHEKELLTQKLLFLQSRLESSIVKQKDLATIGSQSLPINTEVDSDNNRLSTSETGKIQGQVTAIDSGLPLNKIDVEVYVDGAKYGSKMATTDENGFYTISNLASGTYRLRFVPNFYAFDLRDKYTYQYSGGVTRLSQAATVEVVDKGTKTINAILQVGGQITGTVTALNSGENLSGVNIQIYDVDDVNVSFSGTWNYPYRPGQYESFALPTGAYRIAFFPEYGLDPAPYYLPTYFGDQLKLNRADAVIVSETMTRTNVNVQLQRGAVIDGQISNEDTNQPISNASWELLTLEENVDTDLSSSSQLGNANSEGHYQIQGLFPGTYRLGFEVGNNMSGNYLGEYYDNKANYWEATPLVIDSANIYPNINARLKHGGKISGKVSASDTQQGLANVRVTAYGCNGAYSGSSVTDNDGNYTTPPLLSGKYRLKFESQNAQAPNATSYIDQYYIGATTLPTADPIVVTAPNPTSGINVSMLPGAVITGIVTAADSGLPLANVGVSASGYNTVTKQSYSKSAITDQNGQYSFAGLPAMRYSIYFDPSEARYHDLASPALQYAKFSDYDRVTIQDTEFVPNINKALVRSSTVLGRVTDSATSNGIGNVSVEIVNLDNFTGHFFSTNSSGYYTATNLAPGNYRLYFYAYGSDYISEYYNDQLHIQQATPLIVPAVTTISNINATLTHGTRISGHVTSPDNQPLSNVTVAVYDLTGENFLSYGFTDSTGNYTTISGLPQGDYKVRYDYTATPGQYNICDPAQLVNQRAGNKLTNTIHYATEFFNNKPSFQNADIIPIRATTPISDINANLSATVYQVSGRVMSDTIPLANVLVNAGGGVRQYSDASGYFTFTNWLEGSHIFTPTLAGFAMSPISRSVNVTSNMVNQDFEAVVTEATGAVYLPLVTR